MFSCNWQVTWAIKSWQSSGRMHNCSLWFFSCVINHLPYPLFSSSCIFTVCMMLSWCNPFVHLNLLNHKYLFLRCSFRSRSIARVIHLVISTNTSLCFFCASCWVSSLAQMVLLTKRPRVVYCYYLCNHMTSTYTYQPSRNPQLYLYFFSLTGYCYFYLHCCNAFCGKIQECPSGTYKNITGSSKSLCSPCPPNELPHRAVYISIRGSSCCVFFLFEKH